MDMKDSKNYGDLNVQRASLRQQIKDLEARLAEKGEEVVDAARAQCKAFGAWWEIDGVLQTNNMIQSMRELRFAVSAFDNQDERSG